MKEKENEEKLVRITINIPAYKKEIIMKVVEKSSYNNVSEFVRAGIEKELNIQMYKDNLDFIIKELDKMLDAKLKPFVASQRKLNAKYLRTTAINTYLTGEILNKLFGDEMHKQFIELLSKARSKANYYINHDTENMSKQDLYDFYTIGEPYRNE